MEGLATPVSGWLGVVSFLNTQASDLDSLVLACNYPVSFLTLPVEGLHRPVPFFHSQGSGCHPIAAVLVYPASACNT